MPALTPDWTSRFIAYVTQYAGVPEFSTTVPYIRDLHIETPLGEIDTFTKLLDDYRQECADLHRLSSQPMDPQYQRQQQVVQTSSDGITAAFPAFPQSLSAGIEKLAQAFENIELKQKFLTENRAAAADLVNVIKALDKRLVALRTQVAERPIGVTLDELRRSAGITTPIVR